PPCPTRYNLEHTSFLLGPFGPRVGNCRPRPGLFPVRNRNWHFGRLRDCPCRRLYGHCLRPLCFFHPAVFLLKRFLRRLKSICQVWVLLFLWAFSRLLFRSFRFLFLCLLFPFPVFFLWFRFFPFYR